MSIEATITLSIPFTSKLKKMSQLSEIEDELKKFSLIHGVNNKECVYVYVLTLLKENTFFSFDRLNMNELLFSAAQWAVTFESKQKTRPKKMIDIKKTKSQKPFTKLMKCLIEALVIEFKTGEYDCIKFGIELSDYLEAMYEISCIKRDRGNIISA
jgi:hypothetical protein